MLDPVTYQQRRNVLKESIREGIVLFPGNGESPMNYSANPYPFRQDSSFLYFWGLDMPAIAAALDIDRDQEIVFGNELTLEDRIWMGPLPTLREKCESMGLQDVRPYRELHDYVQSRTNIHFLPPYRSQIKLQLSALLHKTPHELDASASPDLIRAVVAQRSIKNADEISAIEASIHVSRAMHAFAMRSAKEGCTEQEIAGLMEGMALSKGYRLAFPTIFSIHGEFLHNPFYENRLDPDDIIIHDSGVEGASHYASDITRTLPVNGRFTQRQKDVYSIVLRAQEKAMQSIRPQIEYREAHRAASVELASGLKELGLMKGDVHEAVEQGAHTLFFPHGIGHMLGLDVHDMESLGEDYVGYTDEIERRSDFGWNALRLARPLEPGFVVTVEPGLYFIPDLIDQWKSEQKHTDFIQYDRLESYKDFGGVRIEDDVCVTEDGCRVLSAAIPKTIADVEGAGCA
ncbi:MAG: aminopeptidase P N-terminal domain-containing protein [Candidatus Omnitrophica bacterium]|nr:aminopeptidase P N-terminal domain-containing protein [Candidatus Omnitrophota bacterium]